MMKKICMLLFTLSLLTTIVHAHLCDNVFAQAKDNLVVKVDVRDGQLRIGREASFRVYLLNTMDRDIAEILLEVDSPQFDADVQPSAEWRSYPGLRTTNPSPRWRLRSAGPAEAKKEYFTVTLRRRTGVPDGSYKIGLNLFSRKMNLSFRSLDLDSAVDLNTIPKTAGIAVDGQATREEWGQSHLCANFYTYRKSGRYMENLPAPDETRVRIAHDDDYLYFLAMFHGGEQSGSDKLSIHIAPTADDQPLVIDIDRTGQVTAPANIAAAATVRAGPQGELIEGRIARSELGIKGINRFHMNFTRTITRDNTQEIAYWRGNDLSIDQPIVYGQFVLDSGSR